MRTSTRMVVLGGFSFKCVLDLISVIASAAYGLRRLSKFWTGAAIRVMRTSDNAQIDIGFATAAQTRTNLAAIPINNDGSSTPPGVTMTVTGTGTEFGQPYVEVRWQGTATSDFFLQYTHSPYGNFDPLVHAPIAAGLTYSVSFGYRLVAGTAPGGTWFRRALIWDANGSHPGTGHAAALAPTPSTVLQRYAVIFTAPAGSSYAQPNLYVLITSGQVVDFTVRFYAANVELGVGNARPLLQRNVPETIADIGDLDTNALVTHVGSDNGFVTTWYDQSGNGRHATQTDPTIQPRIVSNGVIETINGKPGINYVINKGLVITFGTTIAQSFSVLVSPSATWQTYHAIIDTGNNYATRSGAITNLASQGLLPTPLPLSLYRNGISVTPNSTNCLNPISTPFQVTIEHIIYNHASACIGNIESGTGGGCAIQSETIVFSGAVLSTADRETLERNQGAYFDITVA